MNSKSVLWLSCLTVSAIAHYTNYPQQQKYDACDEITTVEQQNQSNTTFSKTVICSGVTSMVLVVYGKNRSRILDQRRSFCEWGCLKYSSRIRHDTIRYDTLYLRAPKSWRIASLISRTEQKNKQQWKILKLECGSMPNVMAALPNIGGALCSTPQSLDDAHY